MTAINLVEQIDFGLTLNVKKGYNPLKPFKKEMTMKINQITNQSMTNYQNKLDPDQSINKSMIGSGEWQR